MNERTITVSLLTQIQQVSKMTSITPQHQSTDALDMYMHTHLSALVSRSLLVMMPMTDEAVTKDRREADSSKLGPNLEGIQSTVITRREHSVYYNLLLVDVSKDYSSYKHQSRDEWWKSPEHIFWVILVSSSISTVT